MDVSCPACAARYTADDEKLRGKTARMRCRACDTVWLVSGPSTNALPRVDEPMPSSRHVDQSPYSQAPYSQAPYSQAPYSQAPYSQAPVSGRGGHAAVVRTGAEREKRDLFATRPPDFGSVKQTLLPPASSANPPMSVGGNGTAARNENSVLFTVDALAGAARVKTPEPSPVRNDYGNAGVRPLSEDDEGIIDLKALSTAPPKPNRPLVAPLFPSDPPPAAFARDASGDHGRKGIGGKIAMFAAAAVVLVLSGVGLAFAFRGEEAVPRAAASAAPAPPPPPVATPAPTPSSDPPPATASASDDDESDSTEPTKKKKKGKKGKKGAHASGPITNKTPPPAQKKVKPADPCGCKGDFNCILACTAKGGK